MPRLRIGWCRNCGHKVALDPRHPEWRHFSVGYGYLLNVNCLAYAGSTNTLFDAGAFHQGQWKCLCMHPEPDLTMPFRSKWVMA
jgi:hypothetical protein